MNTRWMTLIATVGLIVSSNDTTAQSFTNGSFEPTAPGQFVNGGDDKMINAATPGWTINNGSPDWLFGPGFTLWDTNWGDYLEAGGAWNPLTGIDGSISPNMPFGLREGVGQSVTGFAPGGFYSVSFSHTNGFIETPLVVAPPGGWELFVDGKSVFIAPSTNVIGAFFPLPHTSTDWQTSSYTFQATSVTHQFDFMAYGQGLPTAASIQWLDNVSVRPVPEPASLALFALSGAALIRRRQGDYQIKRAFSPGPCAPGKDTNEEPSRVRAF